MRNLLLAVIAVAFLTTSALAAPPLTGKIQDANWIWLAGYEEAPQATVYFRRAFDLPSKPTEALAQITCDDSYKLWVNGTFAAESPANSEEPWRLLNTYDIAPFLVEGSNYIAVEAANKEGKAGLLAQLAIRDATGQDRHFSADSSWEAATEPGEGWQSKITEGNWQSALALGLAATTAPWYLPRTASPLEPMVESLKIEQAIRPVQPVSVKLLDETNATVTGLTSTMMQPVTIATTAPGYKAVFLCEFGEEVVGYPVIMGTTYGNVKVTVAAGEFAAECDDPVQPEITATFQSGGIRWSASDRRAFRFLKITLEPERAVRIDRFEVQAVSYPARKIGQFESSDVQLNRIWDTSRRTLTACMQDYYDNGAKRDRQVALADLRLEALVNYYLFGDPVLAKRSLLQMAALQLPDGRLPAMGPANSDDYYLDYCAYFVIALGDYYRFTEDKPTLETLYPYARRVMDWLHSTADGSGMLNISEGAPWSAFVDLDDSIEKRDRVAAVQAAYYWALNEATELARVLGEKADHREYTNRAAALKAAANAALWSSSLGGYLDSGSQSGPSASIHKQQNALALLAGLPDADMSAKITQLLAEPEKTPAVVTPFMNTYVAAALFEQGRSIEALNLIRSYWGGMLDRRATTFWEEFDPAWPVPYENREMSYCHGWSSGPGYLLPAYVVGVRPMTTGYQEAIIAPNLIGLEWVKAEVPTTKGTIKLDLKNERGCPVGQVTIPYECTGRFLLPIPPEGTRYAVDDRPAGKVENGRIMFRLRGGADYKLSLK